MYRYDYDPGPEFYYEERRPRPRKKRRKRKSGIGWFIFLILLIGLLAAAAITNPTETESKKIVKNTVLTYAEDYVVEKMVDYDGPLTEMALSLGKRLAPKVWDKAVETEVENYIIFTKFKANIGFQGYRKNLLSGIILFGQLIPLDSDLKHLKSLNELMP